MKDRVAYVLQMYFVLIPFLSPKWEARPVSTSLAVIIMIQ